MKIKHVVLGERERILNKVAQGRMSREEAERFAFEQGIPLICEPSAEDFDPMAESTWSLVMAITWIAWRETSKVRQISTAYRARCLRWHKIDHRDDEKRHIFLDGNVGAEPVQIPLLDEIREDILAGECSSKARLHYATGWKLKGLDPVFFSGLVSFWRSEGVLSDDVEPRIEGARRDLWGKLEDSDLIGTAIELESGDPCDIPAREWSYLRCSDQTDFDLLRLAGGPNKYRDPRVRRDKVCGLWPVESSLDHTAQSALPPTLTTDPLAPRTRSGQKRDFVAKVMRDLYGEKIPSRSDLPDQLLVKDVSAKSNETIRDYPISRDTILRAAGRKN